MEGAYEEVAISQLIARTLGIVGGTWDAHDC